MRIALERRAERKRREERLEFVVNKIKTDSHKLQVIATEQALELKNKDNTAATLINAVARGFLGRLVASEARLQQWAALKVQCCYRRYMAVKRSDEEKWRKVRVAPSRHALNLMRLRSNITAQRGDWLELFDTNTNTFWYLNKKTAHSTWKPPSNFEIDLFCQWDPWPHPYESLAESNKPCRKVFETMTAFQQHRISCHCWICPACDYKNIALNFPKCVVCYNSLDRETGEDLSKTLEQELQLAFMEFKKPPLLVANGQSSSNSLSLSEESGGSLHELMSEEFKKGLSSKVSFRGHAPTPDSKMTPSIECQVDDPALLDSEGNGPATEGENLQQEASNNTSTSPDGFPDRLSRTGMASSKLGGNMTANGHQVGLGAASTGAEAMVGSGEDDTAGREVDLFSQENLRVCPKFQVGKCNIASCALAHPGLRDSAIPFIQGKGRNKRYFVKLCSHALHHGHWESLCEQKNQCSGYHPYVRPATIDIIRKLYPIKSGRSLKIFPSGAKLDGNKKENQEGVSSFNGYGVMTWSNGDVYMGDWVDGCREGLGIFTSHEGREYAGEWFKGARHGWGCLQHANGDKFEGQFKNGAVEGVGMLTSANGDVYMGQFKKNKFHGLGKFKKGNGDEYLGYCQDGKAHGMGVLACANGEKYKGNFVNDKRSGKGVSVSKSGARYAGGWLNGMHQGYGVFISRFGERYVGEWDRGLKHGKGRYVFSGGDFFDGDFVKNKANGKGVYFYASTGNVYAGPFSNDMKNGYGVYAWRSGSRYEGCFKDNCIHGKGFFDFANGATYRGEFVKNKKQGKGIYVWKTGNQYRGDFEADKLCGFGEMTYNTMGHRYLGQWKDNKKHGEGTFWYNDGNIYKGEFKNDNKHGYGLLRYKPNTLLEESYEGMFDRGVRHGHGVYKYKKQDGIVYEGEWHRGLRHGLGTLRWPDGRFYRGSFVRERQTGRGLMVYPDGSQYDGEWRDNERHGEGNELACDGVIYQGRFVHDKKHGPGLLNYIDGNDYHGEWENDHIKGVGTYNFHPSHEEGEKVIKLKVFGF